MEQLTQIKHLIEEISAEEVEMCKWTAKATMVCLVLMQQFVRRKKIEQVKCCLATHQSHCERHLYDKRALLKRSLPF